MEQTVRQQLSDYIVAHQEEFYRLAYSYVKNRDAALDVVQESIVKALAKSDTLRRPEYLKAWFYRILLNESMNHHRRAKRWYPWRTPCWRPRRPPGTPGRGWISMTPSSAWTGRSRPWCDCAFSRT